MTNKELIQNWKTLKIKFKSEKKSIPMLEMFLLCVGETEIDVNGEKELAVAFYQGYDEKGSPAVLFQSDSKDYCWTFGIDSKNKTHIKARIGKFMKLK